MCDEREMEWMEYQSTMCSGWQDYFVWFCAKTVGMNSRKAIALSLMLKLPGVTVDGVNMLDGHTALSLIIKGDIKRKTCSEGTIAWLLSRGAKIDDYYRGLSTVCRAMTPLLFASSNWYDPLIRLLLKLGADANKTTDEGDAPITFLVWRNDEGDFPAYKERFTKTLDVLVEAGADINQLTARRRYKRPNSPRYSPLACATESAHDFAALSLLSLNCDPDGGYDPRSANLYPTPLSLALEYGMHEMALLLVLSGCRLDGLRAPSLDGVPEWLRRKLTSPHSLRDLCFARIRKSLRSGPRGAGGGTVVGGGSGHRRLEAAVRSLPLPTFLKRRVLVVGVRKLAREHVASFCSRGVKFSLIDGVLCTFPAHEVDCAGDDENDTFHDDALT